LLPRLYEGVQGIVAGAQLAFNVLKNPLDTKAIEASMQKLVSVGDNASDGLQETWSRSFGDIQTKGEKSMTDIGDALKSGGLQRGVKDMVDQVNSLISSGLQPGKLFEKELEPVSTAIENLKNKTGSVKDVRDAIATLPDSIPADRKREFLDLVNKEFPNGVAESGESTEAFQERLKNLSKQLGVTGSDASNIRLEEIREKLEGNIQSINQQIDALKRSGQGYSGNARELRSLEGQLKTAKDAFDKFNQSTKIEQDSVQKLEKALAAGEGKIKQVASAATADEKERLAKSTEAFAKHQSDKESLELDQINTSQASQKKQYAETQKQLSLAQEQYSKLTKEEKERASPQLEKINALRSQAAEQRTAIAKAETEREEKLRSTATEKSSIAQQKALDVAKAAENDRLKNIQELVNKGVLSQADADEQRANLTVGSLKNQLSAEQAHLANMVDIAKKYPKTGLEGQKQEEEIRKARIKTQEITTQILEQEKAAYEAHIASITAALDRESNLSQAKDEQLVRDGLEIQEGADRKKADSTVNRLQKLLALETKDKDKRAQLELQLQEALSAQDDARVKEKLKHIDNANTQELARDEELYRTGKLKKEQYEIEKAQSTLSRLEQELALEQDNVSKRIALELQVQQARTSLQEAQLSQRKAQIESENQEYQNQLERQLEPLKAQQSVFDLLNKALENRNKLLSASKDLIQAGSNFLTGQLEAISSVETSEYRRKQLAQGIAAIKLDAAKKEAEMTAASLEAEQQMQRFALMREQIENRVALARQVGETAKLQGQIAVAEADPRTSKAQKDALYIQLDAAKQQQAQLKGIGVLLAQQAPAQEKVFALQKRSKQLEAEGTVTQAQAALINTLGPGSKERAARAFQEQQSQKVFGTSYQDVRSGSRALARETVDREIPGANLGTGAGMSGFAPYLEEVNGSVAAMAQANTDLARTMGPAATAGVGLVGAGAASLRLPDVVGKIPGLDEINRGSQDAIAQSLQAYQQEGLKLPTGLAGQQLQLPKVSTDGMAKSSSTFEKAVSQFAKAVQSSQQTKKTSSGNNVTLNVNQSQSSDIGNILTLAKQLS